MLGQTSVLLCREGLYYLFVLSFIVGGAILRDVNLLLVLAGLMIGPLLYSWRMAAVTLRDVRWSRKLPDSACVGDPLLVEITAANDSQQVDGWGVVVEERIARESADESAEPLVFEVKFAHLPAGKTQRAAYQGRLARRGRYRFGPLVARTRYPLGLMEGTAAMEAYDTLVVCPRPGRLTKGWFRLLTVSRPGSERASYRQGAIEGEYYGIRDWQSGDSRRLVHWRTSARRQKLAVRQFETRHRPDLAIVLQLWRPDDAGDESPEVVEQAVRFAATVVADMCHRTTGKLLLAIAGREALVLTGPASTALGKEMREALAVAEATAVDRLAETLDEALPLIPPGTTTVVLTTRPRGDADADPVAARIDEASRPRLGPIHVLDAAAGDLNQLFLPE